MRIRSIVLGVAAGFILTSCAASAALCTRLPLSDVALNQADATTAARTKLNRYAVDKLTERGWSGEGPVSTHNETVTCTPYFSFGTVAAGYRCLVTATFCVNRQQPALQVRVPLPTIRRVPAPQPAQRPEPPDQARQAPPRQALATTSVRKTAPVQRKAASPTNQTVKLRLKGSSYEISGVLKKYDKVSYVIAPPDSENITVPADRFDCVSGACPKPAN